METPKRTLFITRKYPPVIGGMEIFSRNLFEHWKEYENLELLANRCGNAWLAPFLLKSLLVIFTRGRRYSRIHLGDGLMAVLIPWIRLWTQVSVSISIHGLDIVYNKYGYNRVIPRLVARGDIIICVSHYTRDRCLERGIPDDKCKVIPNGINPDNSPYRLGKKPERVAEWEREFAGKKILLSIGRLMKRKGHAHFIRYYLGKLPESFVFFVAGTGPEEVKIKTTARECGLEERVYMAGRISEEEKQGLYGIAYAFIMPNISVPGDIEGFGIAAIEAGLTGLPLILSGIEGTGEIKKQIELVTDLDSFVKNPEQPLEDPSTRIKAVLDWKRIALEYHNAC